MAIDPDVRLKNYTTKVAVSKTLGEITDVLTDMGATAIVTDYENKVLTAISFRLETKFGLTTYRIPVNIEAIYQEIQQQRKYNKIAMRERNHEQAARIAWRIAYDWIDAQMAFLQVDQIEIEQLMLPYMIVDTKGSTLYDYAVENKSKILKLTHNP